MPVTVQEARDWLRIDGEENEAIIEGLLRAAQSYRETSTGVVQGFNAYSTSGNLCDACTRYLLTYWYYGESADVKQLESVIDSLLKAITYANDRHIAEEFPEGCGGDCGAGLL